MSLIDWTVGSAAVQTSVFGLLFYPTTQNKSTNWTFRMEEFILESAVLFWKNYDPSTIYILNHGKAKSVVNFALLKGCCMSGCGGPNLGDSTACCHRWTTLCLVLPPLNKPLGGYRASLINHAKYKSAVGQAASVDGMGRSELFSDFYRSAWRRVLTQTLICPFPPHMLPDLLNSSSSLIVFAQGSSIGVFCVSI